MCSWRAPPDVHLAAGERRRGEERRRLDAVRDGDVVAPGAARRRPRPRSARCRRPRCARPSSVSRLGQVLDLGLARRVLDHGRALGEHRRHEDVVGRRVARVLEHDAGPDEPVAVSLDVAVLGAELSPELAERAQVEVDRALAEVVATRQRQPRPALAGEQRAEHDDRGPHPLDQLVGRHGHELGGRVDEEIALSVALDRGAERPEHVGHDRDIGDTRDVASRVVPSASRLAAMSFRAEFLAPWTGTSPRRGPEGRTRKWSIAETLPPPAGTLPGRGTAGGATGPGPRTDRGSAGAATPPALSR